jgi:predicted transglutaminase-like cysteine proteinase
MIQSSGGRLRAWRSLLLCLIPVLSITLSSAAQSDVIRRTYTWTHAGRAWTFTYDFPLAAYQLQTALTRTLDYTRYSAYVDDPRDDAVLRDFVAKLEQAAVGLTVWERLNLVVALVQSLPYVGESCEYPRYPLEMLVDQQGDCEDAAILTAALVKQMGFDAVLLAFLEERHMAVGIRVLPPGHKDLQAYAWNGDLYFYLEPTSLGWEIGQIPAAYHSQPAIIALHSTYASEIP